MDVCDHGDPAMAAECGSALLRCVRGDICLEYVFRLGTTHSFIRIPDISMWIVRLALTRPYSLRSWPF
jgi:hypothetical protein